MSREDFRKIEQLDFGFRQDLFLVATGLTQAFRARYKRHGDLPLGYRIGDEKSFETGDLEILLRKGRQREKLILSDGEITFSIRVGIGRAQKFRNSQRAIVEAEKFMYKLVPTDHAAWLDQEDNEDY